MTHIVKILLVFGLLDGIAATAPIGKPNVVLVLADDQGWSDVGYNNVSSRMHQPGAGNKIWLPNPPRTPNLDAMAMGPNTLLFHRFYAGSAVCSPTRSVSQPIE